VLGACPEFVEKILYEEIRIKAFEDENFNEIVLLNFNNVCK